MTIAPTTQLGSIPEQEQLLWAQFTESGFVSARERLFKLHLPLARRLAARYFRSDALTPIEFEELFQFACVGLLEAIDRFNPELGVPFRYFGSRRISGNILTGLSKHSEVNEQISYRKRVARERLHSIKPTAAATDDVHVALSVLGAIAADLAIGFMLDRASIPAGECVDAGKSAYDSLVWKQSLALLTRQIEQLPERDADIVRLHYFEGVAFSEIATALGLSKGRVSQLHKAAILLLRKRLIGQDHFEFEG